MRRWRLERMDGTWRRRCERTSLPAAGEGRHQQDGAITSPDGSDLGLCGARRRVHVRGADDAEAK